MDLDELAYGFMASQALFAALELNLFDHLAVKKMKARRSFSVGLGLGDREPEDLTWEDRGFHGEK